MDPAGEPETLTMKQAMQAETQDLQCQIWRLEDKRTLTLMRNNISSIHLLGFPGLHKLKYLLFFFLLIMYCLTMVGNIFIIMLVFMKRSLHSPMYFFLTHLSLSDILLATDIIPNMFGVVLHEGATMSFTACIVQFDVFGSLEGVECLLLTVMSYDRYIAICKPLHYNITMNESFCVKSIVTSWTLGFLMTLINAVTIARLKFCGANVIDHFFCDYKPIVELSCSDIFILQVQTFIIGFCIIACPFMIIVASYVCIIFTILKIRSQSGRQKAFFTCSSHLTVVSIFYGTLISVYVVPVGGKLLILGKITSLLYTVVTPLLNPVIYSLRNKDIMESFKNRKNII
ncbi:olfactory receptor 10AG1-like [Rhinoderma darwinii]|uniref:olfactory receptor 10AG1-like n=1 Tax=Rhinoderma darwinii TaxID=43563 RepID=UPI003F6707D8